MSLAAFGSGVSLRVSDPLLPQVAADFGVRVGAAIIVPLGMAYIGDVVPYARRQTMLARFMAGQMSGIIAGQIAGGIIGEHLAGAWCSWRSRPCSSL